jgi:hypothetical protein
VKLGVEHTTQYNNNTAISYLQHLISKLHQFTNNVNVNICYVPTDDNVADITTKVLPSGARRNTLGERLLWDITSGEEEKKKKSGSDN